MISLFLNVLFCIVSFLPAYFDHGERWKAFKVAKGRNAFVPGLKFFLINWGLPLLAFSIIIVSAYENHGTNIELNQLRQQVSRTTTNVANLNPFEESVNLVTASAWIECDTGTELKWSVNLDGDLEKEDPLGNLISLRLLEKNGDVGLRLVAVKRTKLGQRYYFFDFGEGLLKKTRPDISRGPLTVAGDIDKFVNVLFVLANVPEGTAISRGGVTLRVNSLERRYTIPPQKVTSDFNFVYGSVVTNKLPTHPTH